MDQPGLDWQSIVRWCRNARLTNMYLFTLTFADKLFDLGIDPEARFGLRLPSRSERMFAAYGRLYFGGDNVLQYARRLRNLFYVAERPATKLNEFWRIFSAKTVRDLRLLAAKRNATGATQ
jgi:hypothetical protein